MAPSDEVLEEIRARLNTLEKENRRLKRVGAAVLIAAALLIAAASFALLRRAPKPIFDMTRETPMGGPRIDLSGALVPKPVGQGTPHRAVEANEFILKDADGKTRARLFLERNNFAPYGDPVLEFYDDKFGKTLRLEDAGMGFYRSEKRATFFGTLSAYIISGTSGALLSPGEFEVWDESGFSATVGRTDLVTPRTGETHKTSAASLVLFDKDKNVIWRAP